MNWLRGEISAVIAAGLVFGSCAVAAGQDVSGGFIGWKTNGPAVFHVRSTGRSSESAPPVSYYPPPTSLPPDIRRAMLTFPIATHATVSKQTEDIFDHFLPESLNNTVWTNFIAHTNGRSTMVWSVRTRPPQWPAQAPVVKWDTSCLMWGMKGMTAISPSWQMESGPGQVPITALTRRHGYTRGHDIGPDHVGANFAGKKVWFVTADNQVIQTTVAREAVCTRQTSRRDYTILLFSSDLPQSIQPMRVVAPELVFGVEHTKYIYSREFPCPIFKTEQGGRVSADVPGFTLDTYKGGDSGSPNMLPLPDELVFWSGRSTAGASPEMQQDMDRLCALEGLDPKKYQLQWVDLSAYPSY